MKRRMKMILFPMYVDAPCIYIWCFRVHADYGKKVTWQQCAKWLLTLRL